MPSHAPLGSNPQAIAKHTLELLHYELAHINQALHASINTMPPPMAHNSLPDNAHTSQDLHRRELTNHIDRLHIQIDQKLLEYGHDYPDLQDSLSIANHDNVIHDLITQANTIANIAPPRTYYATQPGHTSYGTATTPADGPHGAWEHAPAAKRHQSERPTTSTSNTAAPWQQPPPPPTAHSTPAPGHNLPVHATPFAPQETMMNNTLPPLGYTYLRSAPPPPPSTPPLAMTNVLAHQGPPPPPNASKHSLTWADRTDINNSELTSMTTQRTPSGFPTDASTSTSTTNHTTGNPAQFTMMDWDTGVNTDNAKQDEITTICFSSRIKHTSTLPDGTKYEGEDGPFWNVKNLAADSPGLKAVHARITENVLQMCTQWEPTANITDADIHIVSTAKSGRTWFVRFHSRDTAQRLLSQLPKNSDPKARWFATWADTNTKTLNKYSGEVSPDLPSPTAPPHATTSPKHHT